MLKKSMKYFYIFGAVFLCPLQSHAQNLNAQTIKLETIRANENQNLKTALNAARIGDENAMNIALEKTIDKSLHPIILREYIFSKPNPKQIIIKEWLSKNNKANGAQTIYEIAQRIGIKDAQKPTENYKFNIPKLKQPIDKANEKAPNAKANDLAALNQIISYFRTGQDDKAISLALYQLNNGYAGKAAWYGGLAAYRNSDFETAFMFFSIVTHWQYSNDFTISEGAFWGARAAQKLGKTDSENYFLQKAANIPLSFYGQLALMKLGAWNNLNIPSIYDETKATRKLINNDFNVKNALWLYELGEINLAKSELEFAWKSSQNSNDLAFLYIANALGFEEIANEIASLNNFSHFAKSYPIIDITPNGGSFVLDRALIFAIMRQESRFKANAVSYAGARGLMQLMPSTAAWLAKSPQLKANPNLLHNNKLNVTLGENYLEYVLSLNVVDNSLARALMAYNAGPGNLNSWVRRIKMPDDTLMFIEANPNNQTRDYVKKVMTNLWIYHKRLGQNAPSLEKLALGKAPNYEPQDDPRKLAYKTASSGN